MDGTISEEKIINKKTWLTPSQVSTRVNTANTVYIELVRGFYYKPILVITIILFGSAIVHVCFMVFPFTKSAVVK